MRAKKAEMILKKNTIYKKKIKEQVKEGFKIVRNNKESSDLMNKWK